MPTKAVAGIQKVLDPHCLVGVELKSDKEITAAAGPAKKQLVEQGWTQFLVKVHNPAGLDGRVAGRQPQCPAAARLAGGRSRRPLARPADVQPAAADAAS